MAMVTFDDFPCNCHAKSGSGWFGREEGVKNALSCFITDTTAVVGNTDNDASGIVCRGRDTYFPVAADGLNGIDQYIEQYLLNLPAINFDRRQATCQ